MGYSYQEKETLPIPRVEDLLLGDEGEGSTGDDDDASSFTFENLMRADHRTPIKDIASLKLSFPMLNSDSPGSTIEEPQLFENSFNNSCPDFDFSDSEDEKNKAAKKKRKGKKPGRERSMSDASDTKEISRSRSLSPSRSRSLVSPAKLAKHPRDSPRRTKSLHNRVSIFNSSCPSFDFPVDKVDKPEKTDKKKSKGQKPQGNQRRSKHQKNETDLLDAFCPPLNFSTSKDNKEDKGKKKKKKTREKEVETRKSSSEDTPSRTRSRSEGRPVPVTLSRSKSFQGMDRKSPCMGQSDHQPEKKARKGKKPKTKKVVEQTPRDHSAVHSDHILSPSKSSYDRKNKDELKLRRPPRPNKSSSFVVSDRILSPSKACKLRTKTKESDPKTPGNNKSPLALSHHTPSRSKSNLDFARKTESEPKTLIRSQSLHRTPDTFRSWSNEHTPSFAFPSVDMYDSTPERQLKKGRKPHNESKEGDSTLKEAPLLVLTQAMCKTTTWDLGDEPHLRTPRITKSSHPRSNSLNLSQVLGGKPFLNRDDSLDNSSSREFPVEVGPNFPSKVYTVSPYSSLEPKTPDRRKCFHDTLGLVGKWKEKAKNEDLHSVRELRSFGIDLDDLSGMTCSKMSEDGSVSHHGKKVHGPSQNSEEVSGRTERADPTKYRVSSGHHCHRRSGRSRSIEPNPHLRKRSPVKRKSTKSDDSVLEVVEVKQARLVDYFTRTPPTEREKLDDYWVEAFKRNYARRTLMNATDIQGSQ